MNENPGILICGECGASSKVQKVRRRVCTNDPPLCTICQNSPRYKILSEASVRRAVPDLEREFYPLPAGTVVNCRHPAFRRQRVYYWSDIALRCLELGIDLPD